MCLHRSGSNLAASAALASVTTPSTPVDTVNGSHSSIDDPRTAAVQVKLDKEKDGFPLTALREVNILLSFHHANIVDVKEVVVGNSLNSVYMVMEYMEHDLKALMDSMKQPFSVAEASLPPVPPSCCQAFGYRLPTRMLTGSTATCSTRIWS